MWLLAVDSVQENASAFNAEKITYNNVRTAGGKISDTDT